MNESNELAEHGTDTVTTQPAESNALDGRVRAALRLVRGLDKLGHKVRSIQLSESGLSFELFQAVQSLTLTSASTTESVEQEAVVERTGTRLPGLLEQEEHKARVKVRGYRQQAHDDLRRRLREEGE